MASAADPITTDSGKQSEVRRLEFLPWSPRILDSALKDYAAGRIPTAYLEFTAKCSRCRCAYCDSNTGEAHKNELSFEEIKELILKLKERGLKWLFVCGLGEPREQPRFFELLDFLKEHDINLSYYTNGLAYEKGDVQRLKDYKDNVNILLKMDSFSENVFDEILGRPGAAKKAYAFANELIESGFVKVNEHNETNLGFSIVITKLNLETIPDVVRFCKEHGVFPCLGEMESINRAKANYARLGVSDAELTHLKAKVDDVLFYPYERTLCQGIIPSLHIRNAGEVVVESRTGLSCGWFFQEESPYLEIGNVRTDDIDAVFRRMNDYRISKLPEIERLLSDKTPIISSGGGTKPSSWWAKYVSLMEGVKNARSVGSSENANSAFKSD